MRPETDRTEPGTWQEIIARFERELGPVTDSEPTEPEAQGEEAVDEEPPEAAPPMKPPGRWRAPFDIDEVEAEEPAAATDAAHRGTPGEPAAGTGTGQAPEAARDAETGRTAETAPGAETPEVPDAAPVAETTQAAEEQRGAEPVQPGEPPLLDEPESWEIGALTTRDYSPPQSIHDAGHDSWPVDTEDGEAVPAWSDDADDSVDHMDAGVFDEIGELLLDQVAPADPWDREPDLDQAPAARSEFPLDAFIVPAGVENVSGYRDDDVARRVAHRLDELAQQLRDGGFSSLGSTASVDELSRVLAAVVTGYVARDS